MNALIDHSLTFESLCSQSCVCELINRQTDTHTDRQAARPHHTRSHKYTHTTGWDEKNGHCQVRLTADHKHTTPCDALRPCTISSRQVNCARVRTLKNCTLRRPRPHPHPHRLSHTRHSSQLTNPQLPISNPHTRTTDTQPASQPAP